MQSSKKLVDGTLWFLLVSGIVNLHSVLRRANNRLRIHTGIVHANMEDDEYDGYFIPKGSFILQNNW
jgi:hypothetical protein